MDDFDDENLMRIGVRVQEPYVNECGLYTLRANRRCHLPGSDNEYLGFVLDFLKIPYQLVPFFGDEQNATYQGTLSNLTLSNFHVFGFSQTV